MASFTVLEHTGFDYYTGQPTYDTRVGWACSEGEIEQDLKYTYTYHDGWLAYYRDEWKRLNG